MRRRFIQCDVLTWTPTLGNAAGNALGVAIGGAAEP